MFIKTVSGLVGQIFGVMESYDVVTVGKRIRDRTDYSASLQETGSWYH